MAKRSKRARSLSAKKGWATRRRREAAEHRKRSRAAKKGWKTRHERAKAKPSPFPEEARAEELIRMHQIAEEGEYDEIGENEFESEEVA